MRRNIYLNLFLTASFIFILSNFSEVYAQQALQDGTGLKIEDVTIDAIENFIKKIELENKGDEESKKKLELYKRAIEQIREADKWQAKLKEFENEMQNAPVILKKIREEIPTEESETKLKILANDASLTQLEDMLVQAEAKLDTITKENEKLQEKAKSRNQRRVEIPKRMVELQQQMQSLNLKLSEKPAPEESQYLIQAKSTLLVASKKAIQQEIAALEKEMLSYDIRNELLTAQRDTISIQMASASKKVKIWKNIVNQRRRLEADRAAQQARGELNAATNLPSAVRELIEENARLAELRTGPSGLISKIENTALIFEDIQNKLIKLSNDFRSLDDKAKTLGRSNIIGLIFRKKRTEIPDIHKYKLNIESRQSEIPEIQLRMIELEEIRATLVNIESRATEILDELEPKIEINERSGIEKVLREQLLIKRNYIDALLKDYNTYLSKLSELDAEEQKFVGEVSAYSAYIEEHIFWIRSTTTLGFSDIRKACSGIYWLVDPKNWGGTLKSLYRDVCEHPFIYVSAILLFAGLLYMKPYFKRKLQETSKLVSKAKTDSFAYTINSLLLTLAIAFIWPSIIWLTWWRLSQPLDASEFTRAIACGLYAVSLVYFTVSILLVICSEQGLADSHFRWDIEVVNLLRKNLLKLTVIGLPLLFIVTFTEAQSNEAWKDSLGRLSFITGMLLLSFFFYKTLKLPMIKGLQSAIDAQGKPVSWSRYIWYVLSIIIPVGLVIIVIRGYYYTAIRLADNLWQTTLLILSLFILYEIMLRWLFFIRRTLLLMARKFRMIDISRPEEESKVIPLGPGDEEKEKATEIIEKQDIQYIMGQSRRILISFTLLALFIGLWISWIDVFPALKILRRVELWSTGTEKVMLSDLMIAVVITVMTFVLAENLPGLLEVFILRRLPTDKGTRFAIGTIARYTCLVLGFIIAFNVIGIDWSKMQWLVAAFTVALGFGLQEIFANFFSGLIILFERPMRIGDIVTVGDTSGEVTEIKIRATTITDWTRKELIVPNKEFVTGRVVNWTLSDKILRLSIPVGIAYASDTVLANDLLLKAAHENPHVMKDPAPYAMFKAFGESSLEFELRVYISDIKYYISTTHELHMAINESFKRSGIEIAFPQQDIHIRSICDAMHHPSNPQN